jgi:hypothetical protein
MYKLIKPIFDGQTIFAVDLLNSDERTTVTVNTETNQAYLKWLEEGNTPEPADEPTQGAA